MWGPNNRTMWACLQRPQPNCSQHTSIASWNQPALSQGPGPVAGYVYGSLAPSTTPPPAQNRSEQRAHLYCLDLQVGAQTQPLLRHVAQMQQFEHGAIS